MEIFDVFSMNGIENYPAAGENFLENVILKVSQTHFPRISTPRGGISFSKSPWKALQESSHEDKCDTSAQHLILIALF